MSRQSDPTVREILPSSGRYEGVQTSKYGDVDVSYDFVFHPEGEITGKATDEGGCFEVKGYCRKGKLLWCETSPGVNYAEIENADEYKECILREKPSHIEVQAFVFYEEVWRIYGTCYTSHYTIEDLHLQLTSAAENTGPPQIRPYAIDCCADLLV
ncbi:hypothetical protein BSKO_10935 [Bryopsis sp. KO-2023]|nr:hypothetical protein BSKO_10935 [Bryopsis sp. KO-2023]